MSAIRSTQISTIITAHNCVAYIGAAIESVLAQSHPVDEIVVVDDGSTDETHAIVATYHSAGVQYMHQDNRGPSAARNRGIVETTGELVSFLDGDDVWLPDKIAQQVDYLSAHPEVVLVSGHVLRCNDRLTSCELLKLGIRNRANMTREIVIHNVVGNPSLVMLRRRVFKHVGVFNELLRWSQDWELWIRIASQEKIGFIEAPLVLYRTHSASLTAQRQWFHIADDLSISRNAINLHQPMWWKPILSLRAWSLAELRRANFAAQHVLPRHVQIQHAVQALISNPFEDTSAKLRILSRAMGKT